MAFRWAKLVCLGACLPALVQAMRTKQLQATVANTSEASIPTKFWHWLGNDYIQIDASEAEAKLRTDSKGILMPDEKVEMAFKVGRNKIYFTDARVLLRPKSAVWGIQVTYTSVPYESIKAYHFETAGMWPNMETDLTLYTNLPALPSISVGFRKGTREEKADIYEIGRYFAKKLMGLEVPPNFNAKGSLVETSSDGEGERWFGDAIAWLGGDASQIDPVEVEKDIRNHMAILGDTEKVHMAFKIGRDTTLLTSRRLLRLDVKGITGRTINFLSLPYEVMKSFLVQTAGHFDVDAELHIWTDLPGYKEFQYELRAGHADIKGINALLSDKILGVRGDKPSSLMQEKRDPAFDIFHWLGNNAMQVDPKDAEYAMRQQDILQSPGEEEVLMAFRVGRDTNLLTNKRLLMVDVKAFGKKVEYKSIPYHAMSAYAIQTAGYFDGDSELKIWTGIQPPPAIPTCTVQECPCDNADPPNCHVPPPPPQCPTYPGWQECMSYVTFDLARGRADLWGIQQLLSAFILGEEYRPPAKGESLVQSSSTSPVKDLYHWLENNAEQVDPRRAEEEFKKGGILQGEESVLLAFRLGNDFHIWSSKRFLLVDRKGWMDSGRKVLYQSIPYHAIKAFAVTSAGMFDTDSELEFWTNMPWLTHYKQDLRNGRVDLNEIMVVLNRELSMCRRHPALPGALIEQSNTPIGDFIGWLGNAAYQVDAAEQDRIFHSEKPLLARDEHVQFAAKVSRDMMMLTTTRSMFEDVQGLTGKSVQYSSVPYGSMGAFLVRSAGYLDVDSEMQLFTYAPGKSHVTQPFRKGYADIFEISNFLTKALFRALIEAC